MSLAYFPDFYRINDSSKLVFRVQQLPAAFSSLSTWFVGQDSLDNKNNVPFPFPFLQIQNKKFQEMTNEDAVEFLKGKIYLEDAFSFPEATVQDNN